jgi:hypothetical protein
LPDHLGFERALAIEMAHFRKFSFIKHLYIHFAAPAPKRPHLTMIALQGCQSRFRGSYAWKVWFSETPFFRHFVTRAWLLQRSDYFQIADDPGVVSLVPKSRSCSRFSTCPLRKDFRFDAMVSSLTGRSRVRKMKRPERHPTLNDRSNYFAVQNRRKTRRWRHGHRLQGRGH